MVAYLKVGEEEMDEDEKRGIKRFATAAEYHEWLTQRQRKGL